jgi:Outer membrane protein beta-barrel domain
MKKLLIWTLFAAPLVGLAQGVDVGILAGPTHYFGDLSPKTLSYYPSNLGFAAGGFIRHRLTERLHFRTSLTYLQIRGDEKNGGVLPERGLNFKSDMLEAMLAVQFEIFHLGNKVRLGPYASFGGGGVYFSPSTIYQDSRVLLRPLNTEGQGIDGYPKPYLPIAFQFALGGGLNILFNDRFNLGFEGQAHGAATDYLDDVGTIQIKRYGDLLQFRGETTAFLSNPLLKGSPENAEETYSRGGEYRDWYLTAFVTLSWRLHKGSRLGRGKRDIGCPTF